MNARDLSNHLATLLRSEREAMADFLLAHARFDRDTRWRELRPATVVPSREVVTPIRASVEVAARGTAVEPVTAVPTTDPLHPGEPPQPRTDGVLAAPAPAAPTPEPLHPGEPPPRADAVVAPPASAAPARPRDVEEPLTAELSRLHVTVSRKFTRSWIASRASACANRRCCTCDEP